jgi:hypothetical protein
MPKNAYSQSYRKMSELSSPLITLAVLDPAWIEQSDRARNKNIISCYRDFKSEASTPISCCLDFRGESSLICRTSEILAKCVQSCQLPSERKEEKR